MFSEVSGSKLDGIGAAKLAEGHLKPACMDTDNKSENCASVYSNWTSHIGASPSSRDPGYRVTNAPTLSTPRGPVHR